MTDLEQQRYPVGRFDKRPPADARVRAAMIASIAQTPAAIEALVNDLSDDELDSPYRDGGWTIRQVVHHVPDSHMNAYIRMKLALTEDNPAIKTYAENLWAELPDSKGPVRVSLDLLDALHRRWVTLLGRLSDDQFRRTFVHPEWGDVSVETAVALYEWHCRHHLAHIRQALARRMTIG